MVSSQLYIYIRPAVSMHSVNQTCVRICIYSWIQMISCIRTHVSAGYYSSLGLQNQVVDDNTYSQMIGRDGKAILYSTHWTEDTLWWWGFRPSAQEWIPGRMAMAVVSVQIPLQTHIHTHARTRTHKTYAHTHTHTPYTYTRHTPTHTHTS